MRPNVEFRIELPKTNPSLAKSHFQQETCGYAQKPPPTMIKGISSTSIWLQNDDQRDLLYFDNLELKWWSKGSPLPQFGKDLLYFDNLELN